MLTHVFNDSVVVITFGDITATLAGSVESQRKQGIATCESNHVQSPPVVGLTGESGPNLANFLCNHAEIWIHETLDLAYPLYCNRP